jgi:hypothetical protein
MCSVKIKKNANIEKVYFIKKLMTSLKIKIQNIRTCLQTCSIRTPTTHTYTTHPPPLSPLSENFPQARPLVHTPETCPYCPQTSGSAARFQVWYKSR